MSNSPSSTPGSSGHWEPPSPEHLQQMLPQYEVEGIIGRGGMGAVYRGRQAKLDRPVAIKILPENFIRGDDDMNYAARFVQEARSMAKLDHPAIISVYDFGETPQGQLYFVMEFVDGMDIHQYLHHHGGRLPQEQALAIVAHVLDALDYAHSHGIVHRDIKPANILLNHEGRVKIADFGLAKKFGETSGDSVPALTMTNVAVGTPDFVAPEALEAGRSVDHRADLYAVGVMLYQLLTGKLPRGSFQPPSVLVPEIDPRIDAIVTKATASDPDYRYASASAIRGDLDRIFSQPMARIEAGEDSEAVPVAVPVTDTVKAGGKLAVRGRSTPAKVHPVSPPPASRGPLYLGIGLAAVAVLGIASFLLFKGEDPAAAAPPDVARAAARTTPEPTKKPGPENTASLLESVTVPPVPVSEQKAAPTTGKLAKAIPPEPVPEKAEATGPTPVATTSPAPPSQAPSETLDSAGKPAPPATPQQLTAPAPAKPASAEPTTPVATKTEDPKPAASPLAAIPGFRTRTEAYLGARKTQVGTLAANYLRGLDVRLNQAADSGNLALAKAFRDEKARVETLQKSLAAPVNDRVTAVGQSASLPDLPEGSPADLVTLRQTWETEREKIRDDLDEKLRQSLQVLEAELTKAREFEKADAVVAFREGLGKSGAPAIAAPQNVAAAPTPAAGRRKEKGLRRCDLMREALI